MRVSIQALAAVALLAGAPAAHAQQIEGRVDRLESEMRAVQRKVFPNGAGQYIQPDITAPQAPAGPAPGTPASSAVVDLTQRVTALEQQMASLTNQTEQNGYRLRQLEDAFNAYKRATDAKLAAAPAPAAVASNGDAGTLTDVPARPTASRATTTDSGDSSTASVEKPSTGDPAEDAYLYGYRLWAAKKYPEAETQLKQVVAKYPKSRRASYAQNLLGRAYLDEGKPSLASIAFYDNYKKMPDGERAPDSLYYLAQSLMQLKKPTDACKVYGELTDVYGTTISASMKADVAKGRTAAKCE